MGHQEIINKGLHISWSNLRTVPHRHGNPVLSKDLVIGLKAHNHRDFKEALLPNLLMVDRNILLNSHLMVEVINNTHLEEATIIS
jgi:hypothetical protein